MLLTIKTTHEEAHVLGFLLHKHPDKHQCFTLSFGKAHVFYPKNHQDTIEFAMMLEIDAVALTRNNRKDFNDSFQLKHYVNDRPYVASSFMSTAIAKVLGSALNGTCKDIPDGVDVEFPFEVHIAAVHCKGGEEMIRNYFEPLGYEVMVEERWLDEYHQEWGMSPYFHLRIAKKDKLKNVLRHLFVLLPALDNNKHYFVGEFEVSKLMDKAGDWLGKHPHYQSIVKRYLKHKKSYARKAIELLTDSQEHEDESVSGEAKLEERFNVHENRLSKVTEVLKSTGAHTVIDLGCGSGKLLKRLLPEGQFTQITGMDISSRALEAAESRLYLKDASESKKERMRLIHGALTYFDERTKGFDAAALVEVIEHLDQTRLSSLEKCIFGFARPQHLIVTTPNREYNQLFENFKTANGFRHPDHRFEWTRSEFQLWGDKVAEQYGYSVRYEALAPVDEKLGGISQMAIFTLSKLSHHHE